VTTTVGGCRGRGPEGPWVAREWEVRLDHRPRRKQGRAVGADALGGREQATLSRASTRPAAWC